MCCSNLSEVLNVKCWVNFITLYQFLILLTYETNELTDSAVYIH